MTCKRSILLECSLACIICVVLAQRFAAYWNYQMIRCLLVDGSLSETFCPRNSAVWNHLKDSLLESLVESSLVTSWPSNKVTVVCRKSSLSTISERISWMCFLTIWSNLMTNNSCHSLKIDRFDRYWYWLCCQYPFISTCVNVSEICLDSRNGSMHVNAETWENALHVMFSQDLLFLLLKIWTAWLEVVFFRPRARFLRSFWSCDPASHSKLNILEHMGQRFKNYRWSGRSCFDLCQINLGAAAWGHHVFIQFPQTLYMFLVFFAARVLVLVFPSPSVEVLALLKMISHGMLHCQPAECHLKS